MYQEIFNFIKSNKLFFLRLTKWCYLFPVNLFMTLLAYPMAPVIAYYYIKFKEIPFWGIPWITFDNGIYGDNGHVERWKNYVAKYPKWGLYCQYVAWLWRNKAYNYSYYTAGVEGRVLKESEWIGNPLVESGKPGVEGYFFAIREDGYFGLFIFKHITDKFALRVYLGWKFKGDVKQEGTRERTMMATFISPFRIWKE